MRWPISALYSLRRRGWRRTLIPDSRRKREANSVARIQKQKRSRRWMEAIEPLLKTDHAKIASEPDIESPAEAREHGAELSGATEGMTDPKVEPVVLLKGRPATRFQLLGMVEAKGPNRRRSENGLAIRAAMMEADAVVDLNAERLPGFIRTEHRSSGTAVRAVDTEGKLELKSRWFDNQIRRIRIPMLIMAFLFGGVSDFIRTNDSASTVQDVEDAAHPFLSRRAGSAINLAAWVIISSLTLGMSFLRWPQLVRPTAVCFLTKAGLSGLQIATGLVTVLFLVVSLWRERPTLEALGNGSPFLLPAVMIPATFINIIWSLSFLYFYLYLGRRAWRIDQEFRGLAVGSIRSKSVPWLRRSMGFLAWALAISFALSLIVWQGGVATRAVSGRALTGPAASVGPVERMKETMNKVAWQQATDPNPAARASRPALASALQAVEYDPGNARFVATLGVARYRTNDYSGAIGDLDRSIKLGGFSGTATFFLAMAHAQLGELDQARKLYQEGDNWMREHKSDDPELTRFREEAAAVLYMKSLDAGRPEQRQRAPDSKARASSDGK